MHGETYYFQVPAGAKRFRVAASNPGGLKLADSKGRPAELKPLQNGVFEVAVSPDAAGGVWSVRAEDVTDVAFSDIAPAFAYMSPELLFLPEGVEVLKAEFLNRPLTPGEPAGRSRQNPSPFPKSKRR
jgi:hypothetical protein